MNQQTVREIVALCDGILASVKELNRHSTQDETWPNSPERRVQIAGVRRAALLATQITGQCIALLDRLEMEDVKL